MSDPIRWLDEGAEASSAERELLNAARRMDPPPGAQERIWAALSPQLGPDGGGDGGGSSGNAAAKSTAGTGSSGATISGAIGSVKGVLVGLASVATIASAIAAFVATRPTTSIETAAPLPPVVETLPAPMAEVPPETKTNGETPLVEPLAPSLPADVQPGQTSPRRISSAKPVVRAAAAPENVQPTGQERASRLREESRLLGDARAALRSGDAASALEKLEAMSGRFPAGVLAQEREVLAIEALARAGQRAAASTRAAAFLQAYPTSPHATKVRGFLQ